MCWLLVHRDRLTPGGDAARHQDCDDEKVGAGSEQARACIHCFTHRAGASRSRNDSETAETVAAFTSGLIAATAVLEPLCRDG